MLPFDSPTVSPSSWLTLIGSELVEVPKDLEREVVRLKETLRQGLLGNYEELDSLLEELLPRVWELRVQVLPLLAKINLAEALKKVELEFALIPQKIPALTDATEKLLFGVHLMTGLAEKLLAAHPEITRKMSKPFFAGEAPTWAEIKHEVLVDSNSGSIAFNLLEGSLRIELLLFALDLAADEHLSLDAGICYELNYQSAVAVKTYASAFGLDKKEMPWHTPPYTALEELLLEGPVVSETEMGYVHEKRSHLNSWK